jgi:hypothetical protein
MERGPVCYKKNMKNKQKEWHHATKPLFLVICSRDLTLLDAFDVWHNILERQRKSKICFEKTVFRNIEQFLPFLTF